MATPRQQAYNLAQQLGLAITENHEGRGADVRIEAPASFNFASEHEILIHWYSGSDWKYVIKVMEQQSVYPCGESCDGWDGKHCDWWRPE